MVRFAYRSGLPVSGPRSLYLHWIVSPGVGELAQWALPWKSFGLPFSKTDMQASWLRCDSGYARMSGFMSPTPLALILFVQALLIDACSLILWLFPSVLQLSSFHPSILFIHQPVFPCQTLLGLRQGIDKKRSMGQSLASECLCNRALFSWNQMILLFSLWFPSGCTHLCFCLVLEVPLRQERTRGPSLKAAPVRGSLQAPSPSPPPSPSSTLLPTPSLEGPRSPELCALCPVCLILLLRGAQDAIPPGHGLLLPCCFMTVSTQTLRLSARLCICLDSSQQVFKLRKSDGCSQCDHLLSPLVNRSLSDAGSWPVHMPVYQASLLRCSAGFDSSRTARPFSGGRRSMSAKCLVQAGSTSGIPGLQTPSVRGRVACRDSQILWTLFFFNMKQSDGKPRLWTK